LIDNKYRGLLSIIRNFDPLLPSFNFKQSMALNGASVNNLKLNLISGHAQGEL